MDPVTDVVSRDNPAGDISRYLHRGMEFVKQTWMMDDKWSPGDLLGPDGTDPEVKGRSASHAPPDNWDKVTDRRSATSIGHLPHVERPSRVCVGWGGYDSFTHWQANGRLVPKELVEEEPWSADLGDSVEFVDDEGNTETIMPVIEPKHFSHRKEDPLTLYSFLNEDKEEKRAPRKQKATTFQWDC